MSTMKKEPLHERVQNLLQRIEDDPGSVDWTTPEWDQAISHAETCDSCHGKFESAVAQPFVKQVLEPALRRRGRWPMRSGGKP